MLSNKFSVKAVVAALAIFSASVNAHMKMITPMPYGSQTLDNSPLLADGSDYPCKQRTGVYDLEGASNTMAIGEAQTLTFEGSAVHGGGSCQVSLTSDLAPTTKSTWMVVQSIIGNCPSNVTGNLDDNAAGTGAATFQYTIPQGVAPGDYTIAWSWVNKIGNREFYMNCGPATVTAAKKKRYAPAPKVSKRQSSFPDIFVANLAGVSNGCTTLEGFDTVYPDAGDSVQSGSIGTNFTAPASCTGAAAVATGSSNGSNSASAPAVTSAAASSSAAGVFASGAAGTSASEATTTAIVSPIPAASSAAATSASSASLPAASGGASGSSGSGSSGSGTTTGAQSGACTDEGEWSCSADGSSYQRCASGIWSPVMPMAAGTSCTPGMSANLDMTASKSKRFSNHVRRAHRLADALSLKDRV